MSLTLTIVNVDKLDNGEPVRMVLDRHGLIIGRSPHADWSLPDPKSYISSTHCEIDFSGGVYLLTDKSTNGVYVNGASERLSAPHTIRDGDDILIGHYRLKAQLAGEAAAAQAPRAASTDAWGAWGPSPAAATGSNFSPPASAVPPANAAWGELSPAPSPSGWGRDDAAGGPGPAVSGRGAMSQAWAPPHADAVAPAANPGWGASDWSQPAAAPAAGPAEDVWAKLAIGAEVDWSRGFAPPAQPAPPPAAAPAPVSEPASAAAEAWGPAPATPAPLAAAPALAPGPAAPTASSDVAWAAFLAAAGVAPGDLKTDPAQAAASAGEIVRRLVGGLVVMLEARARAKAQLGAQSTSLEFDGNNPLKFARSPERVVAQLLNPPERGFMSADKAVADSFQDLQAHQMATLAAMQSALKSTLARFSPESIRERAEMRGLLAKILPGARDAAMWQAYEKEFEGVAQGSDEAFMDVFSKAFKQAYEEAAVSMKGKT